MVISIGFFPVGPHQLTMPQGNQFSQLIRDRSEGEGGWAGGGGFGGGVTKKFGFKEGGI